MTTDAAEPEAIEVKGVTYLPRRCSWCGDTFWVARGDRTPRCVRCPGGALALVRLVKREAK